MISNDSFRYDLIIVGGGLVGAGLALALSSSGFSIALIDARYSTCDDPRLFALNSSSCHFLKNLGLWESFAPYAYPIHQVHVSCKGRFGAVRLKCEEVQLPELGHVIPAHVIESSLNDALIALPQIVSYRPGLLQTLHRDDGMVHAKVKTEEGDVNLSAPLVIGADGSASVVRDQLAIAKEVFDYKQSAIVTKTTLQSFHHQIAYERFYAEGAIAMLPLTENECATIWTADNKSVERLNSLSDNDFLHALQKEFGYRLGRLQKIAKRHVFPLQKICAKETYEAGVFLLGNSAHTVHPIAAQGLNLALYEVAVLAEHLLKKSSLTSFISLEDLQKMHARMEKQQSMSIALSHWLTRFFSKDLPLLPALLPFGMMGFDMMLPIKKRFIAKMLGWTGKVPRLLLNASSL